MTEHQPPVGEPNAASGSEGNEGNDKSPSYESYQKVLSEKKKERERARKLEDELNQLREQQRLQEEKRLEEENQFKELYGKTKQELEEERKRNQQMVQAHVDAKKMTSFLDAVKAEVPKQYWGLIDLDQIAMDGDQIDEYSVQKYVQDFTKNYPDIVRPRENRRLPTDSPDPLSGSGLSYEQWLKLPPKERQARFQEMRQFDLQRNS
jgi:hypothetical protein